MNAKVEKFLLTLPDAKRLPVLLLRDIFLSSAKEMTEDIKWNNLTFMCRGHVAFIYTFKQVNYVNVGFFRAVELKDPKGIFEGTGEKMRHIKVTSEQDIPVTQLKKWIKEAILLNEVSLEQKELKKKAAGQK